MATSRGKMSRAPVIYCLIQVRFSPILAIQNYIPVIQDRLRPQYPRYLQGQLQSFRVSADGRSEAIPADTRWEFSTKENTAGFMIQTGSYIYHTSAYTTFDDFLESAIGTLDVISKIVDITFVERIGVRYIDSIVPDKDETLSDYVDSSIMGFPFNKVKSLNLNYSFTQTFGKTPDGELIARILTNSEGTQLPGDLYPCNLVIGRQVPNDRLTAIIDTDHYHIPSSPIDYNINNISDRINSMHDALSEVFWATITDKAYSRWK